MSVIRFEAVSKAYWDQVVLENFSMRVERAETKVVLGGSGSGKSTLLKMVPGLLKPDSGRIFVDGRDITELSEDQLVPIRKQIGMVFQEGALFDSLSVGENVAYKMREDGDYGEGEIQEVVQQLLGFVDLDDVIDKMPSELSGGMKRRVAIARALVGNPRIILYDEPTAGLDPITSRTICELVMKLRDLEGVTSILVTHDLKIAFALASEFAVVEPSGEVTFRSEDGDFCLINTRFVMLQNGRILFEGTDERLRDTNEDYIREFLT